MDRQQDQIEIVSMILDVWLSSPELRLGQLLENVFGCDEQGRENSTCIFGTQDENLREKLKVFKELCTRTVRHYSK